MPVNLEATIAVTESPLRASAPVGVELMVRNQTADTVSVINPDVGTPPDKINWSFSNETYQLSVLLSFHLIAISITNAIGEKLPMAGPNPWVTPILMPRLILGPGNSFTLRINLSDHFQLQQAGKYHLTINYGDEQASAHAETDLLIE